MELSPPNKGCFKKSLRVKVKVDVRNPLYDKVQLKVRGGHICSIPAKYERLSMVCFHCGRLGHGTTECVDFEGDGSSVKKYEDILKGLAVESFFGRYGEK